MACAAAALQLLVSCVAGIKRSCLLPAVVDKVANALLVACRRLWSRYPTLLESLS